MKVSRYDSGTNAKTLVTGCITNKMVLASVASKWTKEGLFADKWSNVIVGWCVKHFNRYRKPPGRHVTELFESWCDSRERDDATVKLIDSYLSSLSDNYAKQKKTLSPEFVLDLAGNLFNKVEMKRTTEKVNALLDAGETDKARELLQKSGRIELGVGARIDVFRDKASFDAIFDKNNKPPLVTYPGAAGHFFGRNLDRGKFLAFLAPMKRGKSYFLMDIVWVAMTQGLRVAYFVIGDMTRDEVYERLIPRGVGRPIESSFKTYPGWFDEDGSPKKQVNEVKVPKHIVYGGHEVEWESKTFKKPLSRDKAWNRIQKRIVSNWGDDSLIGLSVHPNYSITMAGISREIEAWTMKEWVPDVVVIDYADALLHPSGYKESRDGVNENWAKMRALSQSLDCLVVTATQGTRASIKARTLEMEHFSEDIRKAGHVSSVVGINQTEEEKVNQTYRLNFPAVRNQRNSVDNFLYVVGCLDISSPIILSTF